MYENQQTMSELGRYERENDRLVREIDSLYNDNTELILAGQQAEAREQATERAREEWLTKDGAYQQARSDTELYMQSVQAKMDDMNQRLASINRLTGVDIHSEDSLNGAAATLKVMTEEGTAVNLSTDFYKNYITAYYTKLGELRQSQLVYNEANSLSSAGIRLKNSGYIKNWNGFLLGYYSASLDYAGNFIASQDREGLVAGDSGLVMEFLSSDTVPYEHNGFTISVKNIDTDVTSPEEYAVWQQTKADAKADYVNEFLKIGNGLFKIADDAAAREFFTTQQSLKLDILDKNYEITHAQWQYEHTNDSAWLDIKKKALDERDRMVKEYYALNYATYDSTLFTDRTSDKPISLDEYFTAKNEQYKKEHIDAVKEQMQISTDTLTAELEKALQISKTDIERRQQELSNLQREATWARQNYDAMTEAGNNDYEIRWKYQSLQQQIEWKTKQLEENRQRLEELRNHMTWHDLANNGENAIAYGTVAWATGRASIAIGTNAEAHGEESITIGRESQVYGNNSVSLGQRNQIYSSDAIAVGEYNSVYGNRSVAIGHSNYIMAEEAKAVGENNFVSGRGSSVFGSNNQVYSADLVAIGNGNIIEGGYRYYPSPYEPFYGEDMYRTTVGERTVVVGNYVHTAANDAVVLGNGSSAEEDNTVSVGKYGNERRIVHVAEGRTGSDAATVSQTSTLSSEDGSIQIRPSLNPNGSTRYDVSVQAVPLGDTVNGNPKVHGTLNVDSVVTARTLVADDAVIGGESIVKQFHDQNEKIERVGAGAAALAGLQYLPYEEGAKLVGGVGVGHYRGKNATAAGVRYYPNKDMAISLGGTIGNGDAMVNGGISFRFGSGRADNTNDGDNTSGMSSDESRDIQAIKNENKRLEKRVNEMEAMNKELLKRLEALERNASHR